MSSRTRRNKRVGVRQRRRRVGGVVGLALAGLITPLVVALVFGGPSARKSPPPPPPLVRVVGDDLSFQAPVEQLRQPASLVAWLSQIPQHHTVHRGRVTLDYQVDRPPLEQGVGQVLVGNGGTVALPEHVVSSSVALPVVQQAYRNNCETAALSMLLVGAGVNASQVDLLKDLPTSPPVDQQQSPSGGLVWGDPDAGFVGRPDGGSKGGGYGVYPGPIQGVAQKRGVSLTDLSNTAPQRIYASVLSGRPVMAWIGLSDGPYQTWTTRQGKQVVGNFGEHVVVLTGANGANLTLNDPLTGQTDTWTNSYFEQLWQRMGRRALGL